MSELVQTYQGTVMQWHCDHMGHMNVMWYVGKFDEATWNLFALIGVDVAYLRSAGRAMAAVEQRLQYRREVLAGDVVVVRSGTLEVKDKAIRFFHEMTHGRTGEIVATCRLVGVHMDSVTRKATSFPAEMLEQARQLRRAYDFGDRD